jgi:hypothetical protein
MRVSACVLAAAAIATATAAAAADPAPAGAWEAYRGFLMASHNNGDVAPFLTDEGLAQWRAYSPEARKVALSFLTALSALHDVKLVASKVVAGTTQLDVSLECDPYGMGHPDQVKGRVEMVHGPRGWAVRSETYLVPAAGYGEDLRKAGWTAAGGESWNGLRAPGVFPPTIQAAVDAAARDRREGDAWAIADVRAVISGEAAYQSSNNGFYDRLECMVEPVPCIPGYPANGPAYLDAKLATPRNGYHPRFDPGPKGDAGASGSRTSLTSYAYWLIPDAGRAGRAICGDASGVICTMTKAPAPSAAGTCPDAPACAPIH